MLENQKPTVASKPLDENEYEFVKYELGRLSDLLAGLPLDDFIRAAHARELTGMQPFQTHEVRVRAEKAIEFLVETGKWIIDLPEDSEEQ